MPGARSLSSAGFLKTPEKDGIEETELLLHLTKVSKKS